MILATFQAWYGVAIAAATAYLFWTAVAEKGRDQARWLWARENKGETSGPAALCRIGL